jgi:2,3-bisphosphoglycerate-independent phosphoglycerate mutase
MLKRAIIVIYDGLADRPIKELGWKTPLESAKTPNFDKFAKNAMTGMMYPLGFGKRPGSDTSHLEILGYPMADYYTGRGPIEVAGLGVQLQTGDVAFRGNCGTVDEKWNIVDRRAGRVRCSEVFANALDGMEIDGIKFIIKSGTAHRYGIVMRGKGLSAAVSSNDPKETGVPVKTVKPLDDTKEAKFTADVLNKFMKKSYEILNAMDENKNRVANGDLSANFVLFRGAGVYPSLPKFQEKFGMRACCIAGGGLYKGIGAFLGMDIIDIEGANALPDSNIANKFKRASELIKDYDFIFVHVKAADSLAEDGNWAGKKDFIEKVDKALGTLVIPADTLLVMTADHTTPCVFKAHSADPVPILFMGEGIRIDDVNQFNETATARGGLGKINGLDVMPEIMNLLGKLELVGA